MDTNELPLELSSANLEARVGFLSGAGRAVKDALEWYFEPKAWERWEDGRIYHYLGMQYFKKIVPTNGTYINRLFGESYHARMKDKAHLKYFERCTRSGEAGHGLFFLLMAYATTYNFQHGHIGLGVFSAVANIAVNVYPILLQRYNRARIYNALEKLEAAEERK